VCYGIDDSDSSGGVVVAPARVRISRYRDRLLALLQVRNLRETQLTSLRRAVRGLYWLFDWPLPSDNGSYTVVRVNGSEMLVRQ
jgi:hypothetical protein